MAKKLEWKTEKREISSLIEFDHNPRILTPEQESKLRESLEKFGLVEIPAVDVDGTILAGHQRLKVYQKINGNGVIDVRVPNRSLTDLEREEYLIRSNQNGGEWDFDMLKDSFDEDSLLGWGFDEDDIDFSEDSDFFVEPLDDDEEQERKTLKESAGIDLASITFVFETEKAEEVKLFTNGMTPEEKGELVYELLRDNH